MIYQKTLSEDIIFDPQRLQCDITIANELGSGSFGKVYRASDRNTGQSLAVKMLFPGAKLLDSARGELHVLGRLGQELQQSPYLVQMFGVTRLNERDAIVMEYVPNHTLDHHLYDAENRLAIVQREGIPCGIIAGLGYLHGKNIIHADLKSANVLLTANFAPKIADYGLAQVAANTQTSSTVSQSNSALAGTFHYLAPEFFKSDASCHPTKQTDMYALGVLLWQLITNNKPFAALNGTHAAIITYWVKLLNGAQVPEYFEMPEVEQQPDTARLYRLFKPIVTECRAIEPDNRPTALALQLRFGN